MALVCEALARTGITPRQIDDCEIWEVAAMLGANRADDDDAIQPAAGPDGFTWNERRALALARGDPEPSWDDVPPSSEEIAAQQQLMAQLSRG